MSDTPIAALMWNEPTALIDDVVHSIDRGTGNTICGLEADRHHYTIGASWYWHTPCSYCYEVAKALYIMATT